VGVWLHEDAASSFGQQTEVWVEKRGDAEDMEALVDGRRDGEEMIEEPELFA